MLVAEDTPAGCQARWYRNGVLQNTANFNFHMTDMEDVNNWIGRSMWAADTNAHSELDELRIYDRAISLSEVRSSYQAGPDAVFPPPTGKRPLEMI